MLLNEVRGWAKGTLPTYQERKEFFEGIVNGDPDPVALLRERSPRRGTGGARADRAGAERTRAAGVESLSVAALRVEGLARHFGEREALSDVSLSLEGKDRRSSCSDPTAPARARCCACSRRCCARTPAACACSAHALPEEAWAVRGRIGLLGHEPLLYRELSARENLRFHARLHGVAEARIEELLEARRDDRPRRRAAADALARDGPAGGRRPRGAARPRAAAAGRALREPRPGGRRAGAAADRSDLGAHAGDLQPRPLGRAGRGRPRARPARRAGGAAAGRRRDRARARSRSCTGERPGRGSVAG